MTWQKTQVSQWTVCWAWIIPYPCKKTVTRYCCTGRLKENRFPFISVKYHCCDGKEYRFVNFRWGAGFGQDLYGRCRICKKKKPNPHRENCDGIVGEVTRPECPGFEITI